MVWRVLLTDMLFLLGGIELKLRFIFIIQPIQQMLDQLLNHSPQQGTIEGSFLLPQSPLFISGSAVLTEDVEQDIQECEALLASMDQGQQELLRKAERVRVQFSQTDFNSDISYFDTKNMLMSQYLIQLHFYVLFKLNGVDLTQGKGLELYKNLLYLKTLMMKLAPVQKKLEYKTQKILREAAVKTQPVEKHKEAISLRANPHNLMEERTNDNTESKIRKYVVPKITSALMPEDKHKAREARNIDRRKEFLSRELREHFRDDDEQVEVNMISEYDRRAIKKLREREKYEEDNFTRLPQNKKQKQERVRLQKLRIDDVADLSEMKKMNELMKYTGLIEQDFEREQKADRLLERTKKIHKRKPQ